MSYSVDVECESPDDARCLTSAFVLGVARGLVYVGGAGAEAAK